MGARRPLGGAGVRPCGAKTPRLPVRPSVRMKETEAMNRSCRWALLVLLGLCSVVWADPTTQPAPKRPGPAFSMYLGPTDLAWLKVASFYDENGRRFDTQFPGH